MVGVLDQRRLWILPVQKCTDRVVTHVGQALPVQIRGRQQGFTEAPDNDFAVQQIGTGLGNRALLAFAHVM
ncbi:hypothetical protein D3C78_1056730 [compost metagenome]